MDPHQLTWRPLAAKDEPGAIIDASAALPRRHDILAQSPALQLGLIEGAGAQFPGLLWLLFTDGRGPAALLPLQRVREQDSALRLRCLQTVNRFEMLYADAQWRPDVSPHDVLEALRRADLFDGHPCDVLRIRHARHGSFYADLAMSAKPGQWHETPGASVMTVGADHSTWLARQSKNLRGQIRQSEKRLRALGAVQWRFVTRSEALDAAFERFVALEGAGYKGGLNPLCNEPHEYQLMRAATRIHGARGEFVIGELEVNGTLAASQLGILMDRRLHLLRVAYAEAFAESSPGTFLFAQLIGWCGTTGRADHIDCVVTQRWHERWHPTVERTVHATIANHRTARGLLLGVARAARNLRSLGR